MPSRKTTGGIVFVAGLGLLAAAAVFGSTNTLVHIRVPVETVQRSVNAKLPLDQTRGMLHYRIESAQVSFLENGRLGMDTNVHADVLGRSAMAHIVGSGKLSYKNGGLYLLGFEAPISTITDSQIQPEDRKLLDGALYKISAAGDRTGISAARDFLSGDKQKLSVFARSAAITLIRAAMDHQPVYTLQPADTKHALAKLILRGVEVQRDTLVVALDPITPMLRGLAWFVAAIGAADIVCGSVLLLGKGRQASVRT